MRKWAAPLAGCIVILAALVLYLLTLDNGLRSDELLGGDLITHQYAQVQARPSNAPGYPLYTMGGWLWFRLGRLILGRRSNPIPILSSYSVLWSLVSLVLLYILCLQVTRRARSAGEDRGSIFSDGNWLIAGLCTAFYAVTYFFWYYSVTTEQYTSAVAQTLAMVLLALRWDDVSDRRVGDWTLILLALLAGVSLAHMVTVLIIVLPLLIFVICRRPSVFRRPKLLLSCIGAALLPLSSYAFIYVRGSSHPEWRGEGDWSSTWSWFWQFVSTQQGRDELTWSLQPLWTQEFPSLIWGELTWVVLLGGLMGVWALGRRRAFLIYATLALYFAFSWIDRQGNWYQVIMPVYPLLLVGLAAGISRAVDILLSTRWVKGRPRLHPVAYALSALALLSLVALRFSWSLPRADSSNLQGDTGLEPGQAILADEPTEGAAIVGDQLESVSLAYMTDIWMLRPDLSTVSTREAARLLALDGTVVYSTVNGGTFVSAEIASSVFPWSAGRMLVEMRTAPTMQAPVIAHVVERDLGDGLQLLGYEITADRSLLSLYWRASEVVSQDWSVSVRPTIGGQYIRLDSGIAQVDSQHPVHGLYPTSTWAVGEVVRDDYSVDLAEQTGTDGLRVVLYRQDGDGFVNLAEADLALP